MDLQTRLIQKLTKNQFGLYPSEVVTDTENHTLSKVSAVEALEDTVLSELQIFDMKDKSTGNVSTYYNGKTLEKGEIIYGRVTKIELTSGAVRLYSEVSEDEPQELLK